ncbi:MAG: hypothetical protein ABT02_17230 [Comamonadaceae bacterium SCN 68-20]|nr:MAG: hypothetical protein ABT02_17230 [Comamonadaceae bacterium SCN 68-20]OJX13774.1 MAG: hypothetical protein BGO75_00895 [Burkholderiales bacterium 68-20]
MGKLKLLSQPIAQIEQHFGISRRSMPRLHLQLPLHILMSLSGMGRLRLNLFLMVVFGQTIQFSPHWQKLFAI